MRVIREAKARELKQYPQIFRAAGQETRWAVLLELANKGDRSFSSLLGELKVSSNLLTAHLKKLIEAGLVVREDRSRKYRLTRLADLALGWQLGRRGLWIRGMKKEEIEEVLQSFRG